MFDEALLLQGVEESFPIYDKEMEMGIATNDDRDNEDMGSLSTEKPKKSNRHSRQGSKSIECYQKYL